MAVEFREQNGPEIFYCPGRDLAFCYPEMLRLVAERFDREQWPALQQLCAQMDVTHDDLCDTYIAFHDSLLAAVECEEDSKTKAMPTLMAELLERHGWLKQKPMAQVAVLAQLGAVVYGQLFFTAREQITAPNKRTALAEVAEAGAASFRLFKRGRQWWRWHILKQRLRQAWHALAGKTKTPDGNSGDASATS